MRADDVAAAGRLPGWRRASPSYIQVNGVADTILITGATGFVGRRLIEVLRQDGNSSIRAATRADGATLPTGVEVLAGFNVAKRQLLPEAVDGVDCIVHLAARVHVRGRIDDPERRRYDETNVNGTVALAEAAAKAGVRRFVFISTIAVNGSATESGHAFTEASPRLPRQPYAFSKSAAEKGLDALTRTTSMEVVTIRPPLVYGPGVKGNFRTMMDWIARDIPLPFGSITGNRRTLVALDNLVELIRICLRHPAAANQVFLVGDDEDLSTADLLRRLSVAMGHKARLVPFPKAMLNLAMRAVGMESKATRLLYSLQVDSTKAHTLLGWRPVIDVDEGLRRAAVPYRETTGR